MTVDGAGAGGGEGSMTRCALRYLSLFRRPGLRKAASRRLSSAFSRAFYALNDSLSLRLKRHVCLFVVCGCDLATSPRRSRRTISCQISALFVSLDQTWFLSEESFLYLFQICSLHMQLCIDSTLRTKRIRKWMHLDRCLPILL